MGKSPKAGLSEKILARVEASRPLPQGFFYRLQADVQAELRELRRRFQAGELAVSGRVLATSIIEQCREDGIEICGQQGVRAWLDRQD